MARLNRAPNQGKPPGMAVSAKKDEKRKTSQITMAGLAHAKEITKMQAPCA